jgi:hypothetical protein
LRNLSARILEIRLNFASALSPNLGDGVLGRDADLEGLFGYIAETPIRVDRRHAARDVICGNLGAVLANMIAHLNACTAGGLDSCAGSASSLALFGKIARLVFSMIDAYHKLEPPIEDEGDESAAFNKLRDRLAEVVHRIISGQVARKMIADEILRAFEGLAYLLSRRLWSEQPAETQAASRIRAQEPGQPPWIPWAPPAPLSVVDFPDIINYAGIIQHHNQIRNRAHALQQAQDALASLRTAATDTVDEDFDTEIRRFQLTLEDVTAGVPANERRHRNLPAWSPEDAERRRNQLERNRDPDAPLEPLPFNGEADPEGAFTFLAKREGWKVSVHRS